jgi:anti-sigma B factor antagonist
MKPRAEARRHPEVREQMELKIDRSHGSCVFSLAGEIDVYTAPQLKQTLNEAIDQGCVAPIVDLTNVDFIDSTGLGVLVGVLKRVKERDGSLRLVCTSEQIMRIFRITGLDKVFEVFGTVAEADGSSG